MSSSQKKVILFDLPTKKPEYGCWSPNVWKTRLVLNYKSIPYTTTWLKHSEIAPVLSSTGLTPNLANPNDPPTSPYTLPAAQLPDGSFAMESAKIAAALEDLHPSPSLHLDNNLHIKAQQFLGQAVAPILGVIFSRIGRDIILDETYPTWKANKEAIFGISFEDFEKAENGDKAWKAAEPGFRALSEFLVANKKDEGPFLLGSQVCYGDFILAAMLESMRRAGQDVYDRLVGHDENLKKLHEGCAAKEWFGNDR